MRGAAASLLLLCVSIAAAESTYFGTTSDGRLEAGCKLPASGANFTAYSRVLRTAGRTYVHCDVREILLEAYRALGGHRTPRRCSCTARPASGGAARSRRTGRTRTGSRPTSCARWWTRKDDPSHCL